MKSSIYGWSARRLLPLALSVVLGCAGDRMPSKSIELGQASQGGQPFGQLGVIANENKLLLGTNTLLDVVTVLLGGATVRESDGNGSRYSVCYVITAGKPPQLVRFESDAELGGDARLLTSIDAKVIETGEVVPDSCFRLSSTWALRSLEGGIWLGSTAASINSIFGSHPQDGRHTFRNQASVKDAQFDVSSEIDFVLKESKVISLKMTQLVTN